MALVLNDRVKETTTTTGTSDFALGGAVTGFQTFSAGIGANNTTYYAISSGSDWEVGLGTLSSDGLTLARTTILQSSNSDSIVTFGSGSKDIFCTYPASKAVTTDTAVLAPASATDNAIARYDGTTGKLIQNSGVLVDDSNNVLIGYTTAPSGWTNYGLIGLSGTDGGAISFGTVGTEKAFIYNTVGGNLYITNNVSTGVTQIESGNATSYVTVNPTSVDIYTSGNNSTFDTNGNLILGSSAAATTYGSKIVQIDGTTSALVFKDASTAYGNGYIQYDGAGYMYMGIDGINLYTEIDATIGKYALVSPNGSVTLNSTYSGVFYGSNNLSIGSTYASITTGVGSDIFVSANDATKGLLLRTKGSYGTTGQALLSQGSSSGATWGDVVTPSTSSTDNAIARYDGTTGKLIQNSDVTISDTGVLALGITGYSSTGVKQVVYDNSTGSVIASLGDGVNGGFRGSRYSTDAAAPALTLIKYRGTYASPTAVANGDSLGAINFFGYGGTNARGLALINAAVDTYTSDTNISSYLAFSNSSSGSASPSEKMRLTSAGNLGIGLTNPSEKLHISGNFKLSGAIDENIYAVVDAAGVALSPQNGTIQTWTLGASRTPTAGTWNAGESMTLMINDGTAYTVTWTSLPVTWVGGSAPTLATSGYTVIELWKVGTTIYGALVGSVA